MALDWRRSARRLTGSMRDGLAYGDRAHESSSRMPAFSSTRQQRALWPWHEDGALRHSILRGGAPCSSSSPAYSRWETRSAEVIPPASRDAPGIFPGENNPNVFGALLHGLGSMHATCRARLGQ